jgi:hypothetical protein|tara:strand:+ start:177 stop:773 length:597 start_codon:yes stop_codon:yes gene_type:complete
MKYLVLLLITNVIFSQDIKRTSEFKRDVAYGIDCDDTEYRDYKGSPAWKGYGNWLSECDSIRTTRLDAEFTLRSKERKRQKAIQDSIDIAELGEVDLDLDAMWENTVWEEIQDVTEVYGEVEQITAVAGVRGAEAEDEALALLYYRKSMKRLTKLELQKAYGKLMIKRDQLVSNKQPTEKIDQYLFIIEGKISKYDNS